MAYLATNNRAKRLVEFKRLGLAPRGGAGRWRVDHTLLNKRDANDRAEPRTRLVVERQRRFIDEQVKQLTPAWLDELGWDSLATFGFGAELRAALSQRAANLRQHGIDLARPASRRQWRDAQREGVVLCITQEQGGQDIETVTARFRLTVVRLRDAPGGGDSCAEIRRGDRFVVVGANPEVRAKLTIGRAVSVAINAEGLGQVRSPHRNRGGAPSRESPRHRSALPLRAHGSLHSHGVDGYCVSLPTPRASKNVLESGGSECEEARGELLGATRARYAETRRAATRIRVLVKPLRIPVRAMRAAARPHVACLPQALPSDEAAVFERLYVTMRMTSRSWRTPAQWHAAREEHRKSLAVEDARRRRALDHYRAAWIVALFPGDRELLQALTDHGREL